MIYDFGIFHKNLHEVNHISPFLLVHHIKLDNRSYLVLFHHPSTHNLALDSQPMEVTSVRVCKTSSTLVCNMYIFLGLTRSLEKHSTPMKQLFPPMYHSIIYSFFKLINEKKVLKNKKHKNPKKGKIESCHIEYLG